MEEEIKKRGRGRPRKGEVVPPKPKRRSKVGRPPKERRGGAREGAGRKKGMGLVYGDEALTSAINLRVREITAQRVKALREMTKHDDMPFNRMLEAWIEQLAEEYGIE